MSIRRFEELALSFLPTSAAFRLLGFACLMLASTTAWGQPSFAPPPKPPTQSPPSPVRGIYDPHRHSTTPVSGQPVAAIQQAITDPPITPTTGSSEQASDAALSSGAQLVQGGETIARIDGQIVLASDVLWQVNQLIELNRDKIPVEEEETVRQMLLRQQVMGLVDTKLLYADFVKTIPAENLPKVKESLSKPFEESEIPRLQEMLGVGSRGELETKLGEYGTSIDDVQQQFFERSVAGEWLRQRTPKPKEVTREEMLAYYKEHQADYEFSAQARWEEVMIRYDRFAGDREAAWQEVASIGNEVWIKVLANPELRGPIFAQIAKERSHGFTADEGGVHDWTMIGALRCEEINEALRNLEIGQLSDGIASELGWHIIRVLERKEAGQTPFTEAQSKIREQLEQDQRQGLVDEEIKKLRDQAQVWTLFHGDLNGKRLTEVLDNRKKRR